MSERVQALRSKLPQALLSIIASYDSHATADLIRSLHFREIPATAWTAAHSKLVSAEKPTYFLPHAKEIQRRILQNRNRHKTGGVWLPIFNDCRIWLMSFNTWKFGTHPDVDYLQDWVKEQYRALSHPEAHAAGFFQQRGNLFPMKEHYRAP